MKTKRKRLWMIAILALFVTTFIGSCKDKNTEITGKCPEVVSTNPANLAGGVPVGKIITAKFNEDMDPATISTASFTIEAAKKGSAGTVLGIVTYADSTATFTQSGVLKPNTTYNGKITTAVKDVMGNSLQTNYLWSFATGKSPAVFSTDPANSATNVVFNKILKATFSGKMDPSTLTSSTFTLKQGAASVAGAVTYVDSTVTFTPTANLLPATVYTATISMAAKNVIGFSLPVDYVWTFTTGTSPTILSTDPVNSATAVLINKSVFVTFSVPMDPLTLTSTTFTLKQGTTSVAGAVGYSGTTGVFVPTVNLLPNTTYTATITTGAKNVPGIALANDYVWTFTTGLSPTVVSTDPLSLATNVALNKVISVNFSVAMDPLTITTTSFTLKNGAASVLGVVTYSGTTAKFTPISSLVLGATYTATVTIGAKNASGTAMANNYVWTFSTGAIIAPTVLSTDPVNIALNVPQNKAIGATFSVAMDPLTITATTFTVKNGATAIAGVVSYAGTTATFTPSSNLPLGVTYTATLTTGVKNLAGTAMASAYIWTFSTGALIVPTVMSTDPLDNETAVILNQTVSAVFSVPMDPLTLTSTTFTLKQGATSVAGAIGYSGSTVVFVPTVNLLPGLLYTATITTGAKNTIGTSLGSDVVWSFTTGTSPTVLSTDPLNNATDVLLNKNLTVTFSMPMDPLTLTGTTFTLKQGATSVAGAVGYSGSTASFVPTVNLLPNTLYTATITTGAKNTGGIAIANDFVWTFTTGTPPTVLTADPLNNASGVVLSKQVSATFSVAMDQTTLVSPATNFTLKQGLNSVAGTVSYAGNTATFIPTNPLSVGLVYTATITTGAKNASGLPMASDYVWSFTTGTLPTVLSTDPLNNAIDVVLNKVIAATFSVPMDQTTLVSPATNFTLKQGLTPVPGSVSYLGSTASYTPTNPLVAGLVYTATITTGAKNAGGIALASDYVWSFTAGTPPTVLSTDPLNNAIDVLLNKNLTVTFSVPMDQLTLTGTTFTLKQGLNSVSGTIGYNGSTASFVPSANLLPNTLYTATVTTGARNVGGMPLANDFVWTFTTGTSPTVLSTDPLNNAIGVVLSKQVSATFSVPMDQTTLVSPTTNFTLKQGLNSVAGTVSYVGSTATFIPTSPLSAGLVYTATITTGAKNAPGLPMASDYVWSFTTGVAPTVLSTDPLNNAINVVHNKVVAATFSVPMDETTLVSPATNFTLKQGLTPVPGLVSYLGSTASFTPTNPLVAGLVYTATINTGAKNAGGIALANDVVWSFTAAPTPTVLSTDPLNNAIGVALNKVVTATFSVSMDQTTLVSPATNFTLKQGLTTIAGSVTYLGSTASFTPTLPLTAGLVYTATISTGAKSTFNVPLALNYVWSFTAIAAPPVVQSTDPLNNATGVALNKVIAATFDVPMDQTTLVSPATNFTLKLNGVTTVAGTVTYLGNTASFTPTSLLLSDASYTATVTTGAKNLAGVGLASDYVWTFSTVAHKGPIAPSLVSVARFGLISGVGMTNAAGASEIHDLDVGIYPGFRSSITGFFAVDGGPGLIFNGAFYAANDIAPPGVPAMLNQAKLDLVAAYLYAEGATSPAPATIAGDQGGTTLYPGIYKSTSTLLIQSGNLTLDAQGDVNAVWIFQIASDFTTVGGSPYPSPAGGNVMLTGGAQAKNVYWQVGSSAIIGDYTSFKGNILALTSITLNAYARAEGRMLCQNGSIVLTSTNIVTKP